MKHRNKPVITPLERSDMSFRTLSSLLPSPQNSEVSESSAFSRQSKENIKDTIILDKLRPENLPVASISDFVPLRQRDISLEAPFPSTSQINQTYVKTKAFLDSLLTKKSSLQLSSIANKDIVKREAISSVKSGTQRSVKVIEHKKDPLQPVTHRKRKVVVPSEEIQAPILHKSDDPSIKPTKEELDKWRIPSAISNWKNPNGFAISLDNRVAIESIKTDCPDNDKKDNFLLLSEALDEAEREARQRINIKQEAYKELEKEETLKKEQRLRHLAERARQDRENRRQYENEDHYVREMERNQRRRAERELERSNKMSTAEKLRRLAYQQGRDVSDKVVLNAAKATETPDLQYDSRLFKKAASSAASSSNQIFDHPLFNNSQIDNIYRPTTGSNLENEDIVDRLSNKKGRTGPVEFSAADDGKNAEQNEEDNEHAKEYGLQVRKKPHTS